MAIQKIRNYVVLVALAQCLVNSYAQTAALSPEQTIQEGLRRQEERIKEQQQQLQPKADVLEVPKISTELTVTVNESPCFVINEIELIGKDAASFRWLPSMANPYLNQCIGAKGLGQLAALLDAKLVDLGYALTRVSLPEQNLRDGKVTMLLSTGRLANISMQTVDKNNQVIPDAWGTYKNAYPISSGDIINIRNLEQGLEQMQNLPSQVVTTQIKPGAETDTSDILITRVAGGWGDRIHAGLTVDDSGSKELGRTMLSGYIGLDNPFGLNDSIRISGNINAENPNNTHRSFGNSIVYTIPFGYSTLSVTKSRNKFAQYVQGTTATFLSSGDSDSLEAKLHHTIWRTASAKTGVYASVSTRRAHSYLDDVELIVQRRQTTNMTTGLTYKQMLANGSVDADVSYKRGVPWRNAQEDFVKESDNDLTLRPQIWNANINLAQTIKISTQPVTFTSHLRFQQTTNKTLSIDQVSIGGNNSVRGFDGDAVLQAENGIVWRNELSTPFSAIDLINTSAYMGIDVGHVWGLSAENLVGAKLAGMVVGLRAQYKMFYVDVSLATPLYKPQGFYMRNYIIPAVSLSATF